MAISRRKLVQGAMAGVAALWVMPRAALAISGDTATEHVRKTIDELLSLARSAGEAESKAPRLLEIMEQRAAMPQIARFAAGVSWRSMNGEQQERFVAAFGKFISGIYARRFQEYSGVAAGDAYTIDGTVDAGKKGMLVKTSIAREGGAPVAVEWLVSDQPGRPVVADIVIEGVSMLITQREEIGGMLEARGGNIDKLIADLSV